MRPLMDCKWLAGEAQAAFRWIFNLHITCNDLYSPVQRIFLSWTERAR